MFDILGIDHLVLRSRNPESLVGFYCGVLGCVVERRRDDLGLIHLRAGRTLIDIVDCAGKLGRAGGAPPAREGHNLDHLCLRIEPYDEAAIIEHLQANGVEVGEAGSRFGADGDGRSIYCRDPEGNGVELKGPPAA